MTEDSEGTSKSPEKNTLLYIFLAAVAGAAGTTLVGILFSSTTLDWIGSMVQRPNLPRGAIIFVSASDCGAVGGGWQKYDLAEGRYLFAADTAQRPGQTRDGTTKFKIGTGNLPPIDLIIPYRLSRTSSSGGGFPLMRVLGSTGADEGAQYELKLPFENREIDVTPPSIALLACQYVR